MPCRQELNPRQNDHEILNSKDLSEADLLRIREISHLELGIHQNAGYPSARLYRNGVEIIFQENTIGVIRPATVFRLEGKQEFFWENPTVEIPDDGTAVTFKSNDLYTLGDRLLIGQDRIELIKQIKHT